ncbi:PKD domain-containing protein [bacterium]|nr:PKD domain-containing protein [bacterium]
MMSLWHKIICGFIAVSLNLPLVLQAATISCDFSANTAEGTLPLTTIFTSSVSGGSGNYSYAWDFGNCLVSSEANPTHIYTNPGTYTVTIVVSDVSGTGTRTRTDYIRVNYPPDIPLPDAPVISADGIFPGLDIDLTVEERAGVARTGWPVTSGLPLPKGMLTAAGILYSNGIQARPLSLWDDGSVKWLLADFQADVADNGTVIYNLNSGPGPVSPLKATEDAAAITVVTGPLRFVVSKSAGNLFDGVWIDKNIDGQFTPSERMVHSNQYDGAIITDIAGKKFYSSLGPIDRAEIIKKGPMKIVIQIDGGFRSEDGDWIKAAEGPSAGEDLLKYTDYITAYAEKEFVKVDFHLKNSNGSDLHSKGMSWWGYVEFEDLSLKRPPLPFPAPNPAPLAGMGVILTTAAPSPGARRPLSIRILPV